MDARRFEPRVRHDLRGAFARQWLADIALGDVLLKPGEDGAEGGRRVAEQRCVGDAAGVKRVEDDAGFGVETAVKFEIHDHARQFAVLVSLAGLEGLAVDHRHRRAKAGFETGEVAEVGRRRDGDLAAEFLRIGGHRAQRDQARRRGFGEVGDQQVGQQEMPEIIGGDADFKAVGRAQRCDLARQIDGGVEQQRVERAPQLPERVDEGPHAGEAGQVDGEERAGRLRDAGFGCRRFGLGQVAARHDDVPAPVGKRLCAPQPDAR